MTGLLGLVLGIIYLVSEAHGADVNATSLPRPLVASGSTAYISCRVRNSQSMSIVTWYKLPSHNAPGAQTVKLGAGSDVDPTYVTVRRYRINSTVYDVDDKEFRFVITGAQMQDSGNYTCSVTPDNVNSTAALVVAANPPFSLEMKLRPSNNEEQTLTSGDIASLNSEEVLDLVCIARGYPRPSLNLTGPLVTDSPSVTNNVTYTSSATATAGLNKVDFTVSQHLTRTKLRPQNGAKQNVTCSSPSPLNGTLQTLIVFFQFNPFKPIIDCAITLAKEGDKDVNLSCRVLANPLPPIVTWSLVEFNSGALTIDVELGEEQRSPRGTFSIRYYTTEDGYARTNLTLNTPVKAAMFTDYTVLAENSVDKGYGTAHLTAGGTSVRAVSSWMFVLTSVVYLLLVSHL